ncbi:MAG TPA: glycogen-binding domain-containing protein [Gemmatimonadaceae bacterium]|nr:glycogen-binding domain-containing protein [Gemmatimonadaceae bacterium]
MRSRRSPTRAAIVATLLASSGVGAQQQGEISISGGTATDQRGVRSSAVTLAPSVLLAPSARVALSLGASATRFQSGGQSIGGAGVLSARHPLAPRISMSFDVSGAASRFSGVGTAATFASGDAMPSLELDLRALRLFAGGRFATGHASSSIATNPLPLFGGGGRAESHTTTGAGPTFGAAFTALASSGVALRTSARADMLRVAGVTITDQSLAASVSSGVVALAGSVGRRSASDEHASFGNASVALAINPAVWLQAAAGRYASNRLTGTPGGDYVDLGLAIRFGGARPALPASPRVDGAPKLARGFTRLAIEASDAQRVDVAGDFNEWTPLPARRAGRGVWYVDLRIPAGQYRYAFRVNAKEWRVPRGATAVADGFGGKSAWLTVAETGQQ